MTAALTGWNWGALLGLAILFAFGLFDAVVPRRKDWACATWFVGLVAMSAWIAFPLTTSRLCIGAVVFVFGLALLTFYYRRAPHRQAR